MLPEKEQPEAVPEKINPDCQMLHLKIYQMFRKTNKLVDLFSVLTCHALSFISLFTQVS